MQLEQDETEALVASLNVNEQNSSNGNDTTIVDMGDCNENDKEEDAFVGIVTSFCDITGSDPISARTFLEVLVTRDYLH